MNDARVQLDPQGRRCPFIISGEPEDRNRVVKYQMRARRTSKIESKSDVRMVGMLDSKTNSNTNTLVLLLM